MRSSLARFCARTHAWLEPSSAAAAARAKSLTFHRSEYVLGFTDRGLEDVGTVWSVNRAAEDGARVGAGDELLQIECAAQPPISTTRCRSRISHTRAAGGTATR